jgi:polyhydroxyalkanoate synthase
MPKQVDERPFKLGRNLACSEGAVVFRNPVCEVIQYKPQASLVQPVPLLIVPPQINKYYIVDLAPDKSYVKYAMENGLQLFCISWRNPTSAQRDWGMETYVSAAKEAIDVVREITGSESVNLMAACAGGFTTAVLLGHLWAAGEQKKINSLTLLVTVLDTSAEMLLGLFANESAIKGAISKSRRQGVLDGGEMARTFAWLRPNDLVWNYVANNYVMGNSPPAFDVLYWNNDTTRLPAQFHSDILNLFQKNPLPRPGGMKILGTEIDMKKVDCPVYIIAGITDHITPWQACYLSTRLFGGKTKFVLSSSGHIQSIVNPPGNPKAKFYELDDYTLEADDWLERAKLKHGSWWEHWRAWIAPLSGAPRETPPRLGSTRYPAGDAAPGRYVYQR